MLAISSAMGAPRGSAAMPITVESLRAAQGWRVEIHECHA